MIAIIIIFMDASLIMARFGNSIDINTNWSDTDMDKKKKKRKNEFILLLVERFKMIESILVDLESHSDAKACENHESAAGLWWIRDNKKKCFQFGDKRFNQQQVIKGKKKREKKKQRKSTLRCQIKARRLNSDRSRLKKRTTTNVTTRRIHFFSLSLSLTHKPLYPFQTHSTKILNHCSIFFFVPFA